MKTKLQNTLAIVLILLPIGILSHVFLKYAINIPHWDDHALRAFQVNYNNSTTIFEKIHYIFLQHNEHRIALTRLFSLLIYQIKGTIDYRWLMILGNISLIGVLGIFFTVFKKYKINLFYFVPVPFLLFGLQLHENLFWGMASVQNFWVVLWVMLSFYFLLLSDNKYSFIWAIFSVFWAINTSGNGVLVPLIGAVILFYQHRKLELIYWLSASSLFIFIYFFHYQTAPDASLTHTNLGNWQNLLKGFFIYLGSMADTVPFLPQFREKTAVLFGVFLSAFSLVYLVKMFKRYPYTISKISKKYNFNENAINLFWLACLGFIVGTAAMVAYTRLGFGTDTLFGSKYKIYSTLLFIICYLVIISWLKTKQKIIGGILAILAAVFFNFYSYMADYQQVINTRQQRICDQFNLEYNMQSEKIASKSANISHDTFRPEPQFYSKLVPQIIDTTHYEDLRKFRQVALADSSIIELNENVGMSDFKYTNPDDGLYLIATSGKNTYISPIRFVLKSRKMLPALMFGQKFIAIGQIARFSKYEIKTKKYQLGVIKMEGEKQFAIYIGQQMLLEGTPLKEIKKNW